MTMLRKKRQHSVGCVMCILLRLTACFILYSSGAGIMEIVVVLGVMMFYLDSFLLLDHMVNLSKDLLQGFTQGTCWSASWLSESSIVWLPCSDWSSSFLSWEGWFSLSRDGKTTTCCWVAWEVDQPLGPDIIQPRDVLYNQSKPPGIIVGSARIKSLNISALSNKSISDSTLNLGSVKWSFTFIRNLKYLLKL